MKNTQITYLKDYTEPNYWVNTIDLYFEISENIANGVIVTNKSVYFQNKNTINTLILNGNAQIIEIKIDNDIITNVKYEPETEQITLINLPTKFSLTIKTKIYPDTNKNFMGLYLSRDNLFTQCEPQGFRKITYFQDRPDVLAIYTTHIIAPEKLFTHLLSNGNKINDTIINGIRNVTWHDPFKKPSYLFALVCGNFAIKKDIFITKSNKQVNLEIYSQPKYINDLEHAMQSLKKAMQFDENRFNLEYDLDTYMIVASPDFNMGAMENKGLNIFNTKYVLANPSISTDNDLIMIEAVIGHEYFHNYTGNRVTCKNWFQLSLKEGLTVFREQEFSASMHDVIVNRINDVKLLRNNQFAEDASGLAHPVRPEEYLEINNFYTTTVYEKGAEIIRMYQTILGINGFNLGLKNYLSIYDGQSATCENFLQAMASANQIDLQQLMLWYTQAGTPQITVNDHYDNLTKTYILEFKQNIPNTPNQINKLPLLIPIKFGLLDSHGYDLINFQITEGRYIFSDNEYILLLDNHYNKFIFNNIKVKPIPSLLRNFSAPVILHFPYSLEQRLFLIKHDSDLFNRYEHLQQIFNTQIIDIYNASINNKNITILDNKFIHTVKTLINNPNLSPEFRAYCLKCPSSNELLNLIHNVLPENLANAIDEFQIMLGNILFDNLMELYNLNLTNKYNFNDHSNRSLKNTVLSYIVKVLNQKINNPHSLTLLETIVLGQFNNADNMTDKFAILQAINDIQDNNLRETIFNNFYLEFKNEELAIDKWFSLNSMSKNITINEMNKLMLDKAFIATNPNKIYALLWNYTYNIRKFNSQEGYSFITDQIIAIDKFNPQVASKLATGFNQVTKLHIKYKKLATPCLKEILSQNNLSNNVREIISKILEELKN